MKHPKTEVKIKDHGKADSYTDRGRYSVVINGQMHLSGNTEVEALSKALAWVNDQYREYRQKHDKLHAGILALGYEEPTEGED